MVKLSHIVPPIQLTLLPQLLPEEMLPQLFFNYCSSIELPITILAFRYISAVLFFKSSHAISFLAKDRVFALSIDSESNSHFDFVLNCLVVAILIELASEDVAFSLS